MPSYVLSYAAKKDLASIREYLSARTDSGWGRVSRMLKAAFIRIGQTPGIGHARSDIDAPYRYLPVGQYLVVYVPSRRPVAIARVIHAARDVGRVLG